MEQGAQGRCEIAPTMVLSSAYGTRAVRAKEGGARAVLCAVCCVLCAVCCVLCGHVRVEETWGSVTGMERGEYNKNMSYYHTNKWRQS